jgi:hypothetical protein
VHGSVGAAAPMGLAHHRAAGSRRALLGRSTPGWKRPIASGSRRTTRHSRTVPVALHQS